MMSKRLSTETIEKIMASLHGIQQADAPDFFYTRLKTKMQPVEEQKQFFMLRPAFITTVLSVLLIVNVVSLFTIDKAPKQNTTVKSDAPATIESFASAYNMHTESVYE